MTDTGHHRIDVYLPNNQDVIQRLETLALAAIDHMTPTEYHDRLELAALDPESEKAFIVKHDNGWVIVEWPSGCELIRIHHDELTENLPPKATDA
jgi:hypothetical protein